MTTPASVKKNVFFIKQNLYFPNNSISCTYLLLDRFFAQTNTKLKKTCLLLMTLNQKYIAPFCETNGRFFTTIYILS